MNALHELRLKNPAVDIAALLDPDGALVASLEGESGSPEVLASFVSSLRLLGERTISELGGGDLETMIVDGTQGRLVIAYAGVKGFVAAFLRRDAPLGQALVDVRSCASQLAAEA